MEKTRVPKGKKYWYIYDRFEVTFSIEDCSPIANKRFETNNYFHTDKEAESMARKLRAVLAGADVIKWPSKKEFEQIRIHESFNMWDEETNGKAKGWKDCFNWLKSKIVK